VVTEVMAKVVMDKGVLSGGNRWSVLLLLKLGDGLVDEAKKSFGNKGIRGRGADVVGGGLRDDGGVSHWVDQQDAGRNGVGVPRVLEDGGEEDGGLGGGDVWSWTSGSEEREVWVDEFSREIRALRGMFSDGEEGGVVVPKGRGRAWLGRQQVMMNPSLGGRPKEVFDGLTSGLDVELVDVVKV